MADTLSWAWNAYLENRELVTPLLAPLATVAGSLATLTIGSFAAWVALKQVQIARLRHEEQTKADLQRRITESFIKAAEQLANDKLPVRLGGIYTLERIARESEVDYWPVMETLTAFVRERARWKGQEDAASKQEGAKFIEVPGPETDIAAVLSVLVRRDSRSRDQEQERKWHLDLSSSSLRGADLRGAHLEGANLRHAHLEFAKLRDAHLEGADLRDTHLQAADLRGAHLKKADLRHAHLEGADFSGAHIPRTWGAHLAKTEVSGADLEEADLRDAYLERADL